MRFVRKLRAIRETWLEVGWLATLVYAVDRVLRSLHIGQAHCYIFVSQSLSVAVDKAIASRQLYVRELRAEDFRLLSDDPDTINYRLGQNAIAIGLFKDELLIGSLWYTLGPYAEDEVRAFYRPIPEGNVAWDFGVTIAERYRLGRAFITLWLYSMESMQSRGCTYSLSRINAVNSASVRSHMRLGARVVGHANFLRIGRMQFALSDHSPRVHISFSPRSYPTYKIDATQKIN